jgi:ABC-type multidrug transport system fused ATPase/permease subunit
MFGAFSCGNATAFGPDVSKATAAAVKIFTITNTPSDIDALADNQNETQVDKATFRGEIEFRDVWFRYPTRRNQWIFKGLNLKINPKDNIAIVGESGQGKSTLIGLIMRFYDPDFGQVLIDGVDVKQYNINQLRERMGLVMQEPTLFNYSVKENILYGNMHASNQEIKNAVDIANATEFIESQTLEKQFDDSAASLRDAFEADAYKSKLVSSLGQEKYDAELDLLKKLCLKEIADGKFEPVKNELEKRTPQEIGDFKLHPGYEISCGNRGSKLSGGQKQRIAIARAIVRMPNILLLDEATSALDEESQRKVQTALEKCMVGRTSIVIAHRLTTVEKCNRIAVLADGKIAEDGTFNQLTNKQSGYFANLAAGMKKVEQMERKGSRARSVSRHEK